MRSKIKVDGKFYKPVPWLSKDGNDNECDGCAFQANGCINDYNTGNACDDGNEFCGMILIPATNRGWADYIALKLEKAS